MGLDPELAQAVADVQQRAGVAQVVHQLAIHLRDEVAGGAVSEAGIKADATLAQALIGLAKDTIGAQLPALVIGQRSRGGIRSVQGREATQGLRLARYGNRCGPLQDGAEQRPQRRGQEQLHGDSEHQSAECATTSGSGRGCGI